MARSRRDLRLFDAQGREVTITMACLSCRKVKPFSAFGIRRMPDGRQRSIPWCSSCRGGYRRPADEVAHGA